MTYDNTPGGPDGPPAQEKPKGLAYLAGVAFGAILLGLVISIAVGGLTLLAVKIWQAVFGF